MNNWCSSLTVFINCDSTGWCSIVKWHWTDERPSWVYYAEITVLSNVQLFI